MPLTKPTRATDTKGSTKDQSKGDGGSDVGEMTPADGGDETEWNSEDQDNGNRKSGEGDVSPPIMVTPRGRVW